jgi:hypothetical protein
MTGQTLASEASTLLDQPGTLRQSEAALALTNWRDWVTAHRVAAAILAGFVATHIATIVGYWFPSIGLPKADFNTSNGLLYLGPTAATTGHPVVFWSGALFHYTDGIVFAIMYMLAFHPALPWRSSARGNLLKGLTMGTILAVVVCVWMAPRVYDIPHAGFFSFGLGWKFVLAIFLWHWVWGLHIGVIYNPWDRRERRL